MFSSKKNILKFLKLKDKSIFVKDFYISTKVIPKRIEHLQEKGINWSEPGRGVSEKVLAVGFCLSSGLFGSCNSD